LLTALTHLKTADLLDAMSDAAVDGDAEMMNRDED